MQTRLRQAIIGTIILCCSVLSAQEALLSSAENYYEFLALNGHTKRPYLNYRTLSDSKWSITDGSGNIWDGNNLGTTKKITNDITYRVYGPDLFTSFNSSSPYGQNDGALWQGKGFNTSLTGGARIEGYGLEITLKPQVCFSQNLAFDFMTPNAAYSSYTGKGAVYGYYGVAYIDAPQRFGDRPFFTYSWGDSEVRYTWKNLTAGFGTQSVWLGPAKINPIMLSNNATPFPKADIGLKRTPITIPKLGWYIGDFEARLFCGYLSESNYFDNDTSNDHNMLSGLSIAYAPSVLSGLTLFANRTYLAKWNESSSWKTIPSLFFVNLQGGGAQDVWDQRASFGFDYLLTKAGFEVYGEAGINDYGPSVEGYIRYPFHSMVYTAGMIKSVPLPFNDFQGELLFEWSNLEISQDFQFQWSGTFYSHGEITQGYTNEGQWLGAGNGTGGNSQYLAFKLYYPKGFTNLYMHRKNPDNDYIYAKSVGTVNVDPTSTEYIQDFKSIITIGVTSSYFATKQLSITGGLASITEFNPLYNSISWKRTSKLYGFRIESGISWQY